MKPLLFTLLAFVPLALGARYYFVCQTLKWCDRATLAYAPVASTTMTLANGQLESIPLGEFPPGALTPPRTRAWLAGLDTLAAYLTDNPGHQLVVEAPLHSSEIDIDGGYFRNLGVARAAEVAGELQRRGVAGERLDLSAYPVTGEQSVVLRLALVPKTENFSRKAYSPAETLIDSTALLGLRFETNSTALSPSDEFVSYAADLVEALNARPELSLELIGHTDNRAEPVFNDSLGLWRAQAVARYLNQLGLERSISVATRGERNPIADNSTPEGRYLNRRVEVRID